MTQERDRKSQNEIISEACNLNDVGDLIAGGVNVCLKLIVESTKI